MPSVAPVAAAMPAATARRSAYAGWRSASAPSQIARFCPDLSAAAIARWPTFGLRTRDERRQVLRRRGAVEAGRVDSREIRELAGRRRTRDTPRPGTGSRSASGSGTRSSRRAWPPCARGARAPALRGAGCDRPPAARRAGRWRRSTDRRARARPDRQPGRGNPPGAGDDRCCSSRARA